LITTTEQLAETVGVCAACQALAVPRSDLYRNRQVVELPSTLERAVSPRALQPTEKAEVRQVLNSDRFQDQTPREVYATLMDAGKYLCSWRTMYRILDENQEVRERRNQLRHPTYAKPELLATQPTVVELGYYQTPRTGKMDLLLPLQHLGRFQPLLCRLADRRT